MLKFERAAMDAEENFVNLDNRVMWDWPDTDMLSSLLLPPLLLCDIEIWSGGGIRIWSFTRFDIAIELSLLIPMLSLNPMIG